MKKRPDMKSKAGPEGLEIVPTDNGGCVQFTHLYGGADLYAGFKAIHPAPFRASTRVRSGRPRTSISNLRYSEQL